MSILYNFTSLDKLVKKKKKQSELPESMNHGIFYCGLN